MAFVRVGVLSLLTTVGSKSQELRQHQQVVVQRLAGLLLGLSNSISLGLLEALLPLDLVGGGACPVLLIDLLVLRELLLELSELGLQSGLLEDLGLLVGVDDLGGNQFIERLVSVLG